MILLAMSVKTTVLVVCLAVLAVQWPLAIYAANKLFADRGLVKAVIPWNIAIMLMPIVGPAAYLITRKFHRDAQPKTHVGRN